MADVVELMDFWSMDDDENIGFVAADSDFQLWLINGIGVSFEDISYSVIDGPDSSGIYELIMDYDDYTTLSELYDSYLGDNEYASESDMTDEEVKEIITLVMEEDNPPEKHSVYRKYPMEKVAMAMKLTQTRPSLKEWIFGVGVAGNYSAEEVNAVMVSGSVDGEPAIFNYSKGTKDDFGFTPGRIATGEDMEELIAQYPLPNVPHHRNEKGFKNYKNNVWRKHMRAEEDSTPVMDPMDFGEPVNWTPMDGTPSLKRRKDAESTGDGNASGYVTFYWTWEMNHPEDYEPNEYDINDEIKGAAEDGEIGWYSFNHDGHEVEAHITQGEQYFDAEGSGEINIGPVYVTKKVPVLFKHDYVTRDYEWSTDEPSYLTDDQESEVVEIVEDIVEDSDEEEGDETFDEYDYQGEVTWNTYKDDGRFYDLGAEGKGIEKEKKLWVVTAMADELIWEEENQFDTTVRVFDNLINAKKYFNELCLMNGISEEALDSPEDHWDYGGRATPQPMDDGDEIWIEFAIKELSMGYDNGEVYSAEGANPSGGATGDQIIAWEHNGLSSPSGPPSDIFWSEGDYGEYVQIFDTTITKKGIEEKLQRAGIKPIEVFSVYEDGTKSKDIFGVYLKEGDAKIFSREFSKNDWTGLFDFEGTVSFAAHMGHSRFQQSNNPRRDMGSTRRKLKQEMFSDVSGVVTLKNMAVLGLAGITGYLIAGRN